MANSQADREPKEKPSLQALRVDSPPTVDGHLNEPQWQQAPAATKLYQYEPHAGEELSEHTEFRFLYDAHHLYLGVWCYDRDPDGIIARSMTRDFYIPADDYLYFMFDTFHDQRNGYVFAVNPNGARYDGLISRGTNTNSDWDGVWRAKTTIDEEGWKAEIEIPFSSVSYDPGGDRWGFNISRNIRRKSERGRWTGARPEIRTSFPGEAGDLLGLTAMKQRLGLELRPFATLRFQKGSDESHWLGDTGLDLRYRITPGLSATLSYSTDFAETEVDDRQVNLTRFPLFFPEKRTFFLEDSGIYDFGGLTNSRRSSAGLRNLVIPYFTRRIGLSEEGEIVPILLADKIAGHIGETEVGFTHVMLEERHGIERKNLFSGRVVKHFGEQSSLGLLATSGDPNPNGDNHLLGADYHFRTSDFLGDKFLQADAFALGTESSGHQRANSNGYAFGLAATYPNEPLFIEGRYMEIGEDFEPALGFVRRRGVRAYSTAAAYTLRPETVTWLREFQVAASARHYTDLEDELDSALYTLQPLELEFASADELEFFIKHSFDSPDEEFEISDGVFIPADDYWWTDYTLSLTLARKRLLSGDIELTCGDFYDGTRFQFSGHTTIMPNKHLTLVFNYSHNQIDLPVGDFTTHLAGARMFWKFNPDLTWSHLLQYDSVSESIGFQTLLQWEYRPGSKLYAVVNQSYLDQRTGFKLQDQEIALKVGANFRF